MRMMTSTAGKIYWLAGMAVLLSGAAVQSEQLCPAQLALTTPDSRLRDNGDGTVTDLATDLVWKQCSEGQADDGDCSGDAETFTWQQALQWTVDFNLGGGFAGHADWRLPNSKELQSIVEQGCWGPSINLARFPNTDPVLRTWTASASSDDRAALTVRFIQGVVAPELRTNPAAVRLVRREGGEGVGKLP